MDDVLVKSGSFVAPDISLYPLGTLMTTPEGATIISIAADPANSTVHYKVAAKGGWKNSAVFFDFDGTLTVSMWVARLGKHAVSDGQRKHVIDALSHDEVVQNFGGEQRLADLQEFLRCLGNHGVTVIVVSHGLVQPIVKHLTDAGLFQFFDGTFSMSIRCCDAYLASPVGACHNLYTTCGRRREGIFASDSPELREHGAGHDNKAKLIKSIIARRSMDLNRTFFIEDSESNMKPAQELGVCKTMLVGTGGISRVGMEGICADLGIAIDQT